MRLKQKIFLVLLSVSILAVMLTGAVSLAILNRALTRELVDHLQSVATIQRHRIEYLLNRYLDRIRLFAGSPALLAGLRKSLASPADSGPLTTLLASFTAGTPEFNDLFLVANDGRLIAASAESGRVTTYNPESFAKGLERENMEVASHDPRSGRTLEFYSCPIVDGGKRLAVLITEIRMDEVLSPLRDYTGLGRTGETLLADRTADGDALYISPLRNLPGRATNLLIPKERTRIPITTALQKKSMTLMHGVDYRGKPVFAVTDYLAQADWGLVVKIDRSEAQKQTLVFKILILAVTVILGSIVFFIASYVSDRITLPVVEMNAIAVKLGQGVRATRTERITDDEIGDLARSFNRLVDNLDAANEKLLAAKRLSDIGMFASIIAHELRNPLAVIRIALANLRREQDPASAKESMENISKKVHEAGHIINNLLSFSRIRDPHRTPTDIHTLLTESITAAMLRCGKPGVDVRPEFDSLHGRTVDVDPVQMTEVLTNLVNNAFDAIESSGCVVVEGTLRDRLLAITVRDDGAGIEEENLKKIFEPFFTTKARGTGLGLAVCQQIVQLHQGTIAVSSWPGKGTEVSLTIPV